MLEGTQRCEQTAIHKTPEKQPPKALNHLKERYVATLVRALFIVHELIQFQKQRRCITVLGALIQEDQQAGYAGRRGDDQRPAVAEREEGTAHVLDEINQARKHESPRSAR